MARKVIATFINIDEKCDFNSVYECGKIRYKFFKNGLLKIKIPLLSEI
jgi:hypothetical protein